MGDVVRFPQRVPIQTKQAPRLALSDPAALLAMPLWGTGSWSEEHAQFEAHHVALFGRVIEDQPDHT